MPTFTITTDIQASSKDCFDLARDIGFHVRSLEHTNERVVAGRTDGLIELGESVTWQAKHLGMTRRMTVEITAMDRPTHFRDQQTIGAFKRFIHDHYFKDLGNGMTRMTDALDFASPWGVLGNLMDRVYLRHYLFELIAQRNLLLKQALENVSSVSAS